mmetsp:Transcript_44693/g.32739  ORF Transcript_44693/g.32739 Transcript_44693/m.32739 type:complete len:88 (+) Transcript_44693:342-605(+)
MTIASTSHDMRTPINTILNMHSLIEQELTDPVIKKYLQLSKTSALILQALVNDTLDYFQIKSGKFNFKPKEFRIQEVLEKSMGVVEF